MDKRLLALRLVLNEISVPVDVVSIDSRKAMQKAVYLAQVVGVPLNYRFNWYVMGPYSPGLTDDYYKAARVEDESIGRTLRTEWRESLKGLKPVLEAPPLEDLSRADWLELLASWHFLRAGRHLSQDQAQERMNELKPRLAPKAGVAENALQRVCLLGARMA